MTWRVTPTLSESAQKAISDYLSARGEVDKIKVKYTMEDATFVGQYLSRDIFSKYVFFYSLNKFNKSVAADVSINNTPGEVFSLFISYPRFMREIFPEIQPDAFNTKEGLEKLQKSLEERGEYQAYKKDEWFKYQELKTAKKAYKKALENLFKKENVDGKTVENFTTDREIIGLVNRRSDGEE
ncbi:MAG TPA: hypothetical protein VFU89_00720 [Rhabdochlamydiaceae bacterium]|nr:hypothetical protein [Rhabdochlamydiaceae bacterium]